MAYIMSFIDVMDMLVLNLIQFENSKPLDKNKIQIPALLLSFLQSYIHFNHS